jgi:hypothetical protein
MDYRLIVIVSKQLSSAQAYERDKAGPRRPKPSRDVARAVPVTGARHVNWATRTRTWVQTN